jgi:adenylate cyclase
MTSRRNTLSRAAVCLIVAGLALGLSLLLRAADPAPVAALRNTTFDSFQRVAPRTFGDYPIRIVDVDERSLAELGQWPWPRTRMAALVERLTELGAAAIALDMIFAEPDRTSPRQVAEWLAAADPERRRQRADFLGTLPDHDEVFGSAIAQARSSSGSRPCPSRMESALPRKAAMPSRALIGRGSATLRGRRRQPAASRERGARNGEPQPGEHGSTGIVRRLPLLFSDGKSAYSGLALETLRVAQGAASTTVRATGRQRRGSWAGPPALVDLKVGATSASR